MTCNPLDLRTFLDDTRVARHGPSVSIDDAPCREVIWTGDEVDLARLPVPEGVDLLHLGIRAQDFLTPVICGALGVTRHPDGALNSFFTMAKVADSRRIHFFMLPGHTAANVAAWAGKGHRCPMAPVIGCHPLYELGAAYSGSHPGFSEFILVASLLGDPVPTTKVHTLDLEIPALAQIVIEGFIDPEKAPYLHTWSHSDSYSPIPSLEPFFDVTAVTLRKDPIYHYIQPNFFSGHHALAEFIIAPPLLKALLDKGLPVLDVHLLLNGCSNCAIIRMKARGEERGRLEEFLA